MLKVREDKHKELEKQIFEAYEKKTPKGKQFYGRACKSFSGGVPGDGGYWRPYPLYMTHGKGAYCYDIDNNEYVDSRCSYGAAVLGHAHPEVIEAIKREVGRGLLLHNMELEVELAELLTQIIPCAEAVRFRCTGTEVVMGAIAVGRAFTKKNKIIKFFGAYHGVGPDVMVGWGSRSLAPTSAGIPKEALANTVVLPYNDIDAIRRKLSEDSDIGVVLTDVINSNGGIFPPKDNFLKELRQLTKDRGAVLIFDEVQTGFRIALGGSQEYFGVTPDLSVHAKAMASGSPLGAIVGKREIMSVLGGSTSGAFMFGGGAQVVYQSGTMNDNTPGTAGAIATLKVLSNMKEKGEYKKLNDRTARMSQAIEKLIRERGLPCSVNHAGSHYKIHFTDEEATFDAVARIDKRIIYLFIVALMTEGVLACGPGSGASFLNFSHTEKDVERILNATDAVMTKFKFNEIADSVKK